MPPSDECDDEEIDEVSFFMGFILFKLICLVKSQKSNFDANSAIFIEQ